MELDGNHEEAMLTRKVKPVAVAAGQAVVRRVPMIE
jgi:hypothetical protein